jgi:hypothetical protein
MREKSCRCGKSKKNFKIDIGSFFVGDCCLEAGFDDLGNPVNEQPTIESKPPDVSALQAFFGVKKEEPSAPKLGRGKLMNMRVEELKNLAKEIEGSDKMTKKQLVESLLK